MLSRTLPALLALALAQAPVAGADNTIRFSIDEGKKRAEFTLNGKLECVLENGQISCTAPSS
jgi:hypothetical protein